MKIPAEPTWIDSTSKLTGDKFKKIFIFFVINAPIPEKTARAIVLPTGVDVPIDYKMVDIADKMEGELRNKNLLSFPPTGDFEQRAVFTRSKNTIILSFIDHIRNSIAHGRFNVIPISKDEILEMEDRNTIGDCAARIVVRTSTLSNWIEDICKRI